MQKIVIILLFFQFLIGCIELKPLYSRYDNYDAENYDNYSECRHFEATKHKEQIHGSRNEWPQSMCDIKIKKFECIGCSNQSHYISSRNLERILKTNPTSSAQFDLEIMIMVNNIPLAIKSDSIATRKKIIIKLQYILKHRKNNRIIAQDTLINIETLPVLESTFSNSWAEEKATEGIAEELLHDLKLDLSSIIKSKPDTIYKRSED